MNQAAEEFRKLCEDNRTNLLRSPWAQQQKAHGWLLHLADEVREALEAPTNEDLAGELGDVLWNTISTIHALEAEGGPPLAQVLETIRLKIRQRKPWIFDQASHTLSPEEEDALWDKNKRESK